MSGLRPIIAAPVDLPVTIDEVKAQAIVDFSDDDVLLQSYIVAATAYLDGENGILGRALMSQSVSQSFADFSNLTLSYGPASSIVSVEYYDETNAVQTLAGASLLQTNVGSCVYFDGDFAAVYDRPDAVTVNYIAGYADAASVPASIKLAITMLAASWYCMRETVSDDEKAFIVPFGVQYLIAPHRMVGV